MLQQELWSSWEQSLNADKPLSLQSLVSIRSLIVNPHTSNSTVCSILETLTRFLNQTTDPLTRHHTVKLLTDLASCHPLIFHSVPLATESIADGDPNIITELDDSLFVSMCFGASVSERLRLLRNAEKLGVQPCVLLTVFLGFTKDPYPYVRKEALDGLVGLCRYGVFQDRSLIEGCYYRGVELLKDAEDCVRSAAVRLVSELGQIIIATSEEEDKRDWSNTVFIQLCSMVRDMSLMVRVEAFNSLGKIKMVSEDILLQTLSKKVLSIMKEKKPYHLHIAKRVEILASNAAGAFVHGLEDEYYEVRQSACYSLRNLIILSAEFADRALNILMDILNDNSLVVRLEALDTLHLMATSEYLNVKEIHMHMFVGSLVDNHVLIRSSARKIFKLARLPYLEFFRLCVDGLLENLEKYPQDEVDIFSVLFHMGRSHGNFAANIIDEVSQEIEPVSDGNLGLDGARVAAYLVLSISVPLSCDKAGQSIPPRLFSYAVILLGRISSALGDIMDQNTLLAYLIQCSRSSSPHRRLEVDGEELSLHEGYADVSTDAGRDGSNHSATPLNLAGNETSEIQSMMLYESSDVGKSQGERQAEEHNQMKESMNCILAKVKDIWLLVQSRCMDEALKILRVCEEELEMLSSSSSPESFSALAFTKEYLKVIKLLAKIWGQIVWKVRTRKTGELEFLFQKLERTLRKIRCQFIRFSKEEELYVLELSLVAHILRLWKVEYCCCYFATLKKLSTTIAHIEFVHEETSTEVSNFLMEVKKTLQEAAANYSVGGSHFIKLVNDYALKEFRMMRGELMRHIYAALDVLDNDSEHPIPFISGLPVAIPLEITLHNVLSETRLWLRMAMNEEELIQFVFLDNVNILGGAYDDAMKFNFVAPFYQTKAASSITLTVSIGMECMFEDIHLHRRSYGGPNRPLVYLCPDIQVYLCA
ncbi:protein SIEL isoform X1 [Euphorbia lathyris]|uniref:protein SIEL isoform X1 n=1 Tax=Euphorbia lathyris TaxID=212925 RepID=UPI003313589F